MGLRLRAEVVVYLVKGFGVVVTLVVVVATWVVDLK